MKLRLLTCFLDTPITIYREARGASYTGTSFGLDHEDADAFWDTERDHLVIRHKRPNPEKPTEMIARTLHVHVSRARFFEVSAEVVDAFEGGTVKADPAPKAKAPAKR